MVAGISKNKIQKWTWSIHCCFIVCACVFVRRGELRCFLSYLCSCQSLFHVLNYHAGCHLSIIGLAAGRNIVLVNSLAFDVTRNGWGEGIYVDTMNWFPWWMVFKTTSMATFSPIWAILSANNLRSSDSELRQCKIKIEPGDIAKSKWVTITIIKTESVIFLEGMCYL